MPKNKLPVLCVDIGGTKTRISKSLNGKTLTAPVVIPTPKSYADALDHIAKSAKTLDLEKCSVGVCGIAGSLDRNKGTIHICPNLPDWSGKPLKRHLENFFGFPFFVENDTALAGLAEARAKEFQSKKIVAYLTVSTGVNGVRIVDGKIDANAFGFEIGHQIINFDARTYFVNVGKGELEDYLGGAAITKREGEEPWQIENPTFWDDMAYVLSIGLINTILYWSPEVIIIGGSVATRINLNIVRAHLNNNLTIIPQIPQITKARLGDFGGLQGALEYIKII